MVTEQPPVRVLLAGDEQGLGQLLDQYLGSRGHRVTRVADGRAALRALRSQAFDVALLSRTLADIDGLEVLRQARDEPTPPECIITTGHGTLDMAIAAMRLGAYDVVARPYQLAALEALVRRASEKHRLTADNRRLASRLSKLDALPDLGTQHPPLQAVLALAGRAAATAAPLLIQGEDGTGKASLARALHRASSQAVGPFVEVSVGTMPAARQPTEFFGLERGAHGRAVAGLVEQAAGGTLCIVDVDQLELGVQGALADALKRGRYKRVGGARRLEFDARIISTTSADLRSDVRSGRVLTELAAALGAVVIALPPLRERAVDIPMLAAGFLRGLGGPAATLSADATDALQRYHWPGNLQELRNVLERGVLLSRGGVVELHHLSVPAPAVSGGAPAPAPVTLAALERRHIEAMLERTGWHQGRAAELLGISAKTLYRKIREYGFQRPGART
jgi:two-component system NtrC family response regulator